MRDSSSNKIQQQQEQMTAMLQEKTAKQGKMTTNK